MAAQFAIADSIVGGNDARFKTLRETVVGPRWGML
jgi:hypothetical protein